MTLLLHLLFATVPSLFPHPSAYKNLSFHTAHPSSFLSARLDATWFMNPWINPIRTLKFTEMSFVFLTHMTQQFHSWVYIQKKWKHLSTSKTCTWMFIAALFITAKMWRQPECPSTDEHIDKMWHIHTMDHYSTIKITEVLIHGTMWMKLENVILNEGSYSQKATDCMILFIWHVQNRQIHRDRKLD